MKPFGPTLKEWLDIRGLQQSDLAKLIGRPPQHISKLIYRTSEPTKKIRDMIFDALNLTRPEFYGGIPAEKPEEGKMEISDKQRIFEIGQNLENLSHECLVNIHHAVVALARLEEAKKNISQTS